VAISPVGVLTRSIWSFYPSQIMGGYADIAATGGSMSNIALYNNTATGNYLWVIGASITGSNNTNVLFEIIQSNPGGQTSGILQFPIQSNASQLDGQMQIFYTSACMGYTIGGATDVTTQPYNWAREWPLAIVAPGQALNFETLGTSTAMAAALWWWVGPQP
jgi:hypothetical protein